MSARKARMSKSQMLKLWQDHATAAYLTWLALGPPTTSPVLLSDRVREEDANDEQ